MMDYEIYTVLLHAFDTFEGACEYMELIIKKGKCEVLPFIKAWENGELAAQWKANVTKKGVEFEKFTKNQSEQM